MSFHSQWRTSAYLILAHLTLCVSLNQLFYHVDYGTLFKIILMPIILFDVLTMGFYFLKKSVPAASHDSLFGGPTKLLGLLMWAVLLFLQFILLKQTYAIATYVGLSIYVLSAHKSFAIPRIQAGRLFASELSFILGFHLMLVSLSFFPEIYSGEKGMDASFLGQYMRHTQGELFDPWFSQKPMGYYSFGYFTWAQFIKIFDIPLRFAYPLSLALVGAFTIQILYALCFQVIKRAYFALLGAFTIFLLPTLTAAYHGLGLPQNFGRFWASTRIYPKGFFSEYTFWSLSFADLHPHVMNYPIILGLIYFLFLYYEREEICYSLRQVIAVGLMWGCLAMTNMWDTLFIAIVLTPLMVHLLLNKRSQLLSLVVSGVIALCLFLLARYQMGVSVPKVFAVEVLKSNFLLPTFLQSGWLLLSIFLMGVLHKRSKITGLLNLGLFALIALSLLSFTMDHLNTIFKAHTFVFLCASTLFVTMLLKLRYLKTLVVLLVFSAIVSLFTLYHREGGRADLRNRIGLDGIRYQDVISRADYEIISWINDNVEGTPLTLEYPGKTFLHGTPRISMLTGLPIYLGWDYHVQLRGASSIEIEQRKSEIRDFYQSRDPYSAHSWAREKAIKYIVLSEKEYTYYPEIKIDVFDNYPNLFKILLSQGRSRFIEVL